MILYFQSRYQRSWLEEPDLNNLVEDLCYLLNKKIILPQFLIMQYSPSNWTNCVLFWSSSSANFFSRISQNWLQSIFYGRINGWFSRMWKEICPVCLDLYMLDDVHFRIALPRVFILSGLSVLTWFRKWISKSRHFILTISQ